MLAIDINCDLGEGGLFDDKIMPLISSCNIACGGHFGTMASMSSSIDLAILNGKHIGAHPSYPDKKHFGRVSIDISNADLKDSIKTQLTGFKNILSVRNATLHHVKPHGALYNDIARNEERARVVVESILEVDDAVILFVPPHSAVQALAKDKLKTWTEGFADRNYNPDYSLVSRSKPDAILHDKQKVLARVIEVVTRQQLTALDGIVLESYFDTLCVHSDTENALDILEYLHSSLPKHNIRLS